MSKTFLAISFGRVFQILISIASLKVMTNLLPPSEVAVFFLILALMNYFGLTMISPIGQYINRQLHTWKRQGNVFNSFFVFNIYLLIVSLSSIPILYFFKSSIGIVEGVPIHLLLFLVAIGVYFNTWIMTIVPTLNMFDYRISFVVFTCAWLLASLLLSVVLVWFFTKSAANWFLGQIIVQLIFSIISFGYLWKLLSESGKFDWRYLLKVMNKKNIHNIVSFTFPLGIATFFMWGITDGYRFVVEKSMGLEYLGLITVGIAVAQRISYAVEAIAQQIFFPTFYKKINTDDATVRIAAWKEMFNLTFPAYWLTTIFIIALAPFLLTILSGKEYKSALWFVIFGAIFHLFRKISSLVSMSAHGEMKTKRLIIPYALGALISTVILYQFAHINYFVTPALLVLGGIVCTFAMIISLRKFIDLRLSWGKMVLTSVLSIPFFISWIFLDKSEALFYSLLITFVFGLYYLFILWAVFRNEKS